MLKYNITLYWSNIDSVVVADVPELPRCTAHGDTYEQALKNVQDAIQFWLDTAKKEVSGRGSGRAAFSASRERMISISIRFMVTAGCLVVEQLPCVHNGLLYHNYIWRQTP